MVHCLLLASAVAAAATAAGEYSFVLGGACGGGTAGAGIPTYNTTTTAYCPMTSTYPRCDITSMVESACTISCGSNPRASIAYRNNSATWLYTDKITCNAGALTNGAGATVYNLQRPNCAFKARCDECSTIAHQPNCPVGMTCNAANLFYDGTGAAIANNAQQLYCTTAKTWSNYSLDGTTGGGVTVAEPFTANCILPNTCAQCPDPTMATTLTQLPAPFQMGYTISPVNLTKESGVCSMVGCTAGYTLYGFSGTSTTVSGLEYTNKRRLFCNSNAKWTNGGIEDTPTNILLACLQNQACGAYDELYTDTRNIRCDNGQSKIICDGSKQLQVYNRTSSFRVEKMVFVKSKGWLSFSCDGRAQLWATSDIYAFDCIDPPTTQAPTTTTQPPASTGCQPLQAISQADLDATWTPGTRTYGPATITATDAKCGAGQKLFAQIAGSTAITLPYTVTCDAGMTEWSIFGPGWNTDYAAHVNVICVNN
ncbi:hypothetical protein PRIPAC_91256 [Pristionchus pacificus]|uniref:Uncharacterized protein n=1 Tax=Pristionchus pacificus TaxID=54126 RepID=A0A2A6CUU0_PRIPA|nr:hypothetical protein PRIPAC_91256 [Pristionchus pacificus]|eukprot:PDM82004.1 hypothetical protein PRIPAC_36397 [Pristionchus pacificus]